MVWPSTARLPAPSPKFRRFILALLIIAGVASIGAGLMHFTGDDMSTEAWSIPETSLRIQTRLSSIAGSLDSARDWLSADPAISAALANQDQAELFALLEARRHDFAQRLPDSTLFFDMPQGPTEAKRGYAIYSASGKLLAWNTPLAATFGFDTALAASMRLPSHDRGVMLENGAIYADLVSIRKVVSKDGLPEAFIATKQQIATKQALAASPATSFIDDIKTEAERPIEVEFGGRPGNARSDKHWFREDLFASPGDPASFIGAVTIGRVPERMQSIGYQILYTLWTLALGLALFSMLVWLLTTIAEVPMPAGSSRPSYSLLAIVALVVVRYALTLLGIDKLLFGLNAAESGAFTAGWGFGIAHDPMELFITSLFACAAAVMIWIIWIPREQLVRIEQSTPSRALPAGRVLAALGASVAAVIVLQLLIDGLSAIVESIIRSSTIRYLTIDRVLPAPGTLLILLAFLGIGVTFLFFAALCVTFGLRAVTQMTSHYLGVWRRIVIGAITMVLLLAVGVWVFDQTAISDTSLYYRAALTALIFLVSFPILVLDARVLDPMGRGQSFLYRLPRSSRSILFILAVSAIIMSPLIAAKQLVGDEVTARRLVVENAEIDTAELQSTAQHVLSIAESHLGNWRMAGSDTGALRNTAFLIWMDGMKAHPLWNAVVDIFNSSGTEESRFATLGTANEVERVQPQIDTELARLRRSDTVGTRIRTVQLATNLGTPAVIAGTQIPDTMASSQSRAAVPGGGRNSLYAVVSLWSELPALSTTRQTISLLPGSANTEASTQAEQGFIIAQYRPNMRRLTNSPALDVPATVPVRIRQELQFRHSVWATTTIGDSHYQTLFYRGTPTAAQTPAIVSVSVPEPSYERTLEFALRLNAIGLLYGALIVLLLLIARQFSTRRIRFTLHFRDRIFLIVLVIALVPLVVVTNVTRNLLAERAQVEEQDRLSRDAVVIKDRMSRAIEQNAPALGDAGIESQVGYMAQIIGRDFSVYDPAGRLRASSRPELYESSLLASTLNSTAVREVIFGNRSFFTEPVQIGTAAYEVGYQPVTSANGSRLLAVLALATMDEQPRIEAEIARTTSFIYGTFAALGLVLLGIGALFAARVASPILELIRATEQVAHGKLETSIPVKREDEIGDLMRAFNTMTRELERSREIVAQTERELAWKEMARQVAHEIKNPLTPMKLSVQHLEHAHEAKDPNFNTIFRRVIRTMREQIDVLTRIATEFSHFGAMPRRRWGAVDIRKVADSAVALFDAERSRIRFIVDVPKDLPRVHSDEEELRRAFVNLLRNSVQAIEGWGVIVIRARTAQGMINIRLRDTGFGMPEETLKRVFDPNFSTKTSGMGLGLAIVKKTVTDMAGTIRVESTPGHGTTFFIDLPARADLGEES